VLGADATRNRNQLLEVATRVFVSADDTESSMRDHTGSRGRRRPGEIAHAQTQTELLAAIDEILNVGRARGELRGDVTAEYIDASLISIFTVARPPDAAGAGRLLNILMDGLRPTPEPLI
jgi:hypothetical protein